MLQQVQDPASKPAAILGQPAQDASYREVRQELGAQIQALGLDLRALQEDTSRQASDSESAEIATRETPELFKQGLQHLRDDIAPVAADPSAGRGGTEQSGRGQLGVVGGGVEPQADSSAAPGKELESVRVLKQSYLEKLRLGQWKQRYCELVVAPETREHFLVYRQKQEKRVLWCVALA